MKARNTLLAAIVVGLTGLTSLLACSSDDSSPSRAPDDAAPTPASPEDASVDARVHERHDAEANADKGVDANADADSASPPANELDGGRDASVPVSGSADTITLTLISPATCEQKFGKLINCEIPPVTVDAAAPLPPGLVFSELTRRSEGNCSTQYPLTLRVEAPDALSRSFDLTPGRTETLQRDDGTALSGMTVSSEGPWLQYMVVDASCRVYLDVRLNVSSSSVDSKATDER